ncbi:MAG: hypothetical protein C0436_00215 [Alphaproteobacteria bacterium]|nr:hypothetical protein [Alphaproteobacteria bacterium]
MDKDAQRIIDAYKMIDLYSMGQYLDDELARIRSEARAEALGDAANRAEAYMANIRGKDIDFDYDDLRIAIADEPKEER